MNMNRYVISTAVFWFLLLRAVCSIAESISLRVDHSEVTNKNNLALDIVLDDATGQTGCAFTLIFPSSILELESPAVTTDFFKPVYDGQSGSVIQPWIKDDAIPGKVMLSGVCINMDPITGGSGNYTGEQVLFSIHFKCKNTASPGVYNIELQQTLLFNPAAGWGTDRNGNNLYDEADGDLYEGAPVLIKAYPKESNQWNTRTLSDDFQISMASFSQNPFTQISVLRDSDEDGVADQYDAFPQDPSEWEDSDGDKIGNNADLDDDNDGISDLFEMTYDLDPLSNDALDDPDKDGYCNLRESISLSNPRNEFDLPGCIADFDDTLTIDGSDIGLLLQEYGTSGCSLLLPCVCDMDGNGAVDFIDFYLFIEDFGRSDCQ